MARGLQPAPGLPISEWQYRIMEKTSRQRTLPQHYLIRLRIIVLSSILGGSHSIHETSRLLGVSLKTVQHWRKVWQACYETICDLEAQSLLKKNQKDHHLLSGILIVLCDAPRHGRPAYITDAQKEQIVALATTKPEEHGLPLTTWTYQHLADVAIAKGIVASISRRHVANILKKKKLQPHRCDYWLFPKIEDWEEFRERVKLICDLIEKSTNGEETSLKLLSVDEKTGIQALSRHQDHAPDGQGRTLRQESEYIRGGTTGFIGATDVSIGEITNYVISPTRTENDYCQFITQTTNMVFADEKTEKIVILADQLNTHMSESLVRWVVAYCSIIGIELGKKGKDGILKNKQSRKQFLEDPSHKVRFIFTPKHCSWLNPIENWFAKLQTQLLNKGNFQSIEILKQKIQRYIEYYNKYVAKPINWHFEGFDKNKQLHNLIINGI